MTYLERDENREKDLYRHPALQASNRQDSFTRVHDIYALGVVLLEIALWKTAARMVDEGTVNEQQRRDARTIRRLYLKIARIEVPWRMGAAYAEAVEACIGEQYAGDFVIPERDAFRKTVVENLSPRMLYKQ